MKRGPKPRPPALKVVEGNTAHKPIHPGVQLPPTAPDEPDWAAVLVSGRVDRKCRADASLEWRRVVPILDAHGVLTRVDATILADYCVVVARLGMAEREISKHGISVRGERGWQKNPAVTAAAQYRTQLRFYIGELGLSPSSRGRLSEGEADPGDEQDILDA